MPIILQPTNEVRTSQRVDWALKAHQSCTEGQKICKKIQVKKTREIKSINFYGKMFD